MSSIVLTDRVAPCSDQLYRNLEPHEGHCWLLIDPVLRPVTEESRLGAAMAERVSIKVSVQAKQEPALTPFLVGFSPEVACDSELIWASLEEALTEMLPESLATGGGRRICGWIQGPADSNHLLRHMSAHMMQVKGARRFLFRWLDPAVLWATWPLLTPAQQGTLLGPMTAFHLLDPAGHLVTITPPQTFNGQALDLSAEQWRDIESLSALNGVLREQDLMRLTREQVATMRDTVMAALRRARRRGFDDKQDQHAFARCALNIHPDFDAHPLIVERLARRETDDLFTALIDDLGAHQWAAIASDLNTQ